MVAKNTSIAIVLAAGKGTRMKSDIPKVLHRVHGVPLVVPILRRLQELDIETYVVCGYKKDMVKQELTALFGASWPYFVDQEEQQGSGHATKRALEHIAKPISSLFVFNADDSFLYSKQFIQKFMEYHANHDNLVTLVTVPGENQPLSLGRLLRDGQGNAAGIWDRDPDVPSGYTHTEVVMGCYGINALWFKNLILEKSPISGEYPLTGNIIRAAIQEKKLGVLRLPSAGIWHSVNTQDDLAALEKKTPAVKTRWGCS